MLIEIEEKIGFVVTCLSLVAFQLGGGLDHPGYAHGLSSEKNLKQTKENEFPNLEKIKFCADSKQ